MSDDRSGTDVQSESEETFLERLEQRPLSWKELLQWLESIAARGGLVQAEERALLLEGTLAEVGDLDAALTVMETRAGWFASAERCKALAHAAEAHLQQAPERKALIRDAGFDRNLPPAECVRRLRTLLNLAPGVLCYEASWRFGVVRRVDPFGRRVEIDFETKAGHSMQLAYAAETVRILPPGHLLARFHREPDAIRELCRTRPAEAVELALLSFGPLPLASLQEKFVPAILEASAWKPFWEAARKALKKEGRVLVPAKRTEALDFRKVGEAEFDSAWFAVLAAERDMRIILDRIEAWAGARKQTDFGAESRAILENRLAFVLKGAEPGHWDYWIRALRLAEACGLTGEALQLEARIGRFEKDAFFFTVMKHAAARDVEPILDLLHRRQGETFRRQVLGLLPKMEIGVLSAAIPLLCNAGDSEACGAAVRDLISRQSASVHLLLWIHRYPERIREWNLGSLPDLVRQTLNQLEVSASGSHLRSQNLLRERIGRPEWLHAIVEAMSETQRREFMLRLKMTPAWPNLERLALLGQIIKRFPELERLMSESAVAPVAPAKGPITSARMYRIRQVALEKIVREEIPANSRDIGVARSHGDLRENFEYKAAKDHQAVLLRRRAELEQQLKEVQPSEFEGFQTERAGLATGIDVEFQDGRQERLYILGAWDRDEALGIVSSDTRLAQAVIGKAPGETFEWSSQHGMERGTLRAVVPLPETIRNWIRIDDAAT
jgi:transcription elongation GreA/GreB family factor